MNRNLYSVLPRNAIVIALTFIWQAIITYLMVPLIIALAGESHYGLWILLSTLSVAGAFAFLDFGLTGSIVKWVASHTAKGNYEAASQVVNISLIIFTPLGMVIATALVLTGPFLVDTAFEIPLEDRSIASLMILAFAVQVVADFITLPFAAVAQAFLRFGWLRVLQAFKYTLFALLSVFGLQAGYGVVIIPFVAAALAVIFIPVMAWLAFRVFPQWRPRLGFAKSVFKETVVLSGKMFTLRIMGTLYRNMDNIIIGVILGTLAVKNYDITYKVHALALLPVYFVTPLIVPVASALSAKGDDAGLRTLILGGSKYLGALCLPVTFGTFILAEPLLTYWLGPKEAAVTELVQLFLFYLFFYPLILVGWNAMIGQNRVGPLVHVTVLTIGSNLVLSLLLIGPMGIAGVIVATVVTNAAAFLIHLVIQLRATGTALFEYFKVVLFPIFASAITGALVLQGLLLLRQPASLLETLIYLGLSVICSYSLFWIIGIEAEERRRLIAGVFARGE